MDLTVFQIGEQRRARNGGIWAGPFKGRPELIIELAPAIFDQLTPLAEKSVIQYLHSLRAWWRLFDSVEATTSISFKSIAQLTDLHRQCAMDRGFNRSTFSLFVRLANTTRTALGLRALHWQGPAEKESNRHLPPTWQIDKVRIELKHRWFATLRRWALADELRQQGVLPADEEQRRLQLNYQRFDMIVKQTKHPRPNWQQIFPKTNSATFNKKGYWVADMLRGSYPDGDDIRAAFHLCLATTGWNAAVLLSLDVDGNCIEPHPKDPSRYILTGTKARAGGTEQITEGLFKTQGSAGAILKTLMARTAPLRDQLRQELQDCLTRLAEPTLKNEEQAKLRNLASSLMQGARSPWLFATRSTVGIQWLTDYSFSTSVEKLASSYLGDVIVNLNRHQPKDRQLAHIKASDLRDAYAARIYHASGGSILSVMKALGHRQPRTTQVYLNNTLLKEEHRKLYGTFSAALWNEIATHSRIDPTVLAKISRDGGVSGEQRERLKQYRTLMLSRIGVGCSDPHHPPRHIAPNFVADEKALCHVQRCTLCYENAVILPESLPGLCKRLAELRHVRANMSIGAFLMSSFAEEIENTELALSAFDATEAERLVAQWSARIDSGEHRVIEFDGTKLEASR
ncbi:tyrosine-type recombinase/integrase [Burkholderia cepacia]|uniref:tyrosine-type recombinase/integrase n=1 Tax=Burkholderia cepacia TaxID=292 RepID=UPI0012D9D212|nr:tyrosine-type recombinase/integrase [Burkholderia cepacia]